MVSHEASRLSPLATAFPAFVAAFALTPVVRRYAVARGLLDVPNARSSHSAPTPRGGGIAVSLVVLGGLEILHLLGRVPGRTAVALLGGGLVAFIGWLDDRRGLPASVRLAAHVAAAAWALWWLRGMPSLVIGTSAVQLDAFGTVLALAAIVWAINVTNFMDGIDGLAAGETATVALTAAALLPATASGLIAAAALTGGAALGFLPWNWRPARLFLGDAGSGFVGFMLAVLAVASERAGALPALVWLILFSAFAVDATVTLVRRAWRGERWYAAHRSHAYQRAAQSGWSHARVTAAVLVLNAGLGGLAWGASRRPALLGGMLLAAGAVCGLLYARVERWSPMAASSRGAVDKSSG